MTAVQPILDQLNTVTGGNATLQQGVDTVKTLLNDLTTTTQTLGVKLGTVRSRIHRGRSQLRKALAHRSPEARAERRSFVARVPALGGGGATA